MILVDIQIPLLDKIFDFELDEGLKVEILLQDILTLIAGEEKLHKGNAKDLFLYAVRQETVLKGEETLECQGILEGDRLILI